MHETFIANLAVGYMFIGIVARDLPGEDGLGGAPLLHLLDIERE